jgi:glycosyltransferase involved in cell wall biosynthesis
MVSKEYLAVPLPPCDKPRVLILFPGPIFFPEEFLKSRLELLSQHYRGTVVSSSGQISTQKYGDFAVVLSYFELKKKLICDFQLWRSCFKVVKRSIKEHDPYKAIISYDPLKMGFIAFIAARLCSAKLIVEVNGIYQSQELYRNLPKAIGMLKKAAFFQLEKFVLSKADGIKALFGAQLFPFRNLLDGKKIAYFFDYVDITRFTPAESEKCILFVGHPFHVKGVDLLLEAFIRVHKEYPEWRLKILGWFSPAEHMLINETATKNPSIEIHPPVPNAEIPQHIGRCAFLVLPSRTEAMGRVLIEAMAAGKPRLGARVGGIPTVITDGKDGLLFESENVNDLCKKMKLLMGNVQLREELGRNAIQRAKADFSGDCYLELTKDLYDSVICS